MSKRKTVKLNLNITKSLIKSKCRSNVVFCEQMQKHVRWVSDWGKIPPKNLPSPEEAAQMCAILQVTPEEILVEQADIELVRSLIDSQKPGQNEKADPTKGTGLSLAKKKLIAAIDELSDEQCEKLFGIIEEAKKLL